MTCYRNPEVAKINLSDVAGKVSLMDKKLELLKKEQRKKVILGLTNAYE